MTNAFGELEFVGYGGKISKYVRVDVHTEMTVMLELMIDVWGMDKPNLLISVTGGAKNFKISKRLKETLRRGLMKTVRTTRAWIITGGTHTGVMKHVGEAVKDFDIVSTIQNPVVTIGIASWGCVQNKDALINTECRRGPAHYRIHKEENQNESFLDPNHSHFILVDNGRVGEFGAEIPFRAKLENEIAKKTENTDEVPIVLLVLEGGIGTLENVHEAIKNNTPAVIVKGSGRVADILAYAYQHSREDEKQYKDQKENTQNRTRHYMENTSILYQQVQEMMDREFRTNKIQTYMKWIQDCLERSDFMSVFELDSKSGSREIDVSMLRALLKANKNDVMNQLRLALAWNRLDVAKNDIFTYDKRWPTDRLDELMLKAIELNRTDFVELFMDHGVSLMGFLTKERLLDLYNEIPEENSLLRTLFNKKCKSRGKTFSLHDVGHLIQDLMGDNFNYRFTSENDPKAQTDVPPSQKVTSSTASNPETKARGESEGRNENFKNPFQELFIWSLLMMRQDMAKLFWAEGKDAIAGALVADGLLKAMKEETEDTQQVIKLQEYIDEWSHLAIGVLNECHSNDEKKAKDLLVRKLDNWGDATCMLIALKADNKDFISQTACQQLLSSIWMGKLIQQNRTLTENVRPITKPSQIPGITKRLTTSSSTTNSHASRHEEEIIEKKEEDQLKLQTLKNSVRDTFCYFFQAPFIIFLYNVVSYLIFLSLFAYILLFDLKPKVSNAEFVLMVWVFTLFIEEIRQVIMTPSSKRATKAKIYIKDKWNIIDLTAIVLFIVGTILRFIPSSATFEASRLFLALSFSMFFLRLLHIFSIHKTLGPQLVMIGGMMQDLLYFLLILMAFVISYAIASHSIMFPNSPMNWETISTVMQRSYWNIYGELFLEEFEGEDDCTFNETLLMIGTNSRCPSHLGKIVVPIMMAIYTLLTNVLLLNLLIAMFSYTFQKIQDRTDKHWCYQRFLLIYEYSTRPVLCPPLIVFAHIGLLIRYIYRRCCCDCSIGNNNEENVDYFYRRFKNGRELAQWEDVVADAYHYKREQQQSKSTDYRLDLLKSQVDEILDMMNQQTTPGPETRKLSRQTAPVLNTVPRSISADTVLEQPRLLQPKLSPQLDTRLASMEQQMEWIIQAMQANNLVPSIDPLTVSNLREEREKETEQL